MMEICKHCKTDKTKTKTNNGYSKECECTFEGNIIVEFSIDVNKN